MTDRSKPPNFDPKKLDFSQFHDLMHPIGGRMCHSQYGGPRRHAKLWWEFKAEYWLHRNIGCKWFHRHNYQQWWQRHTPPGPDARWTSGYACIWCAKPIHREP